MCGGEGCDGVNEGSSGGRRSLEEFRGENQGEKKTEETRRGDALPLTQNSKF